MRNDHTHQRKGQSAIEYLMTYGWMLLVVAIVGGAIFATVQGQCSKSGSLAAGSAITIDQWAPTSNNLQFVFRNSRTEDVTIESVNVSDDDGNVAGNLSVSKTVESDSTGQVVVPGISSSDSCNNYDLTVTFDRGDITGAEVTGSITGQMAP